MQSEPLACFELRLDYKIFFDNQYGLLCIQHMDLTKDTSIQVRFGSASTAAFYVFTCFQFFFFFCFSRTKSAVNSILVYCLQVPQITLFSNFFIKNESHDIIHTFKNYLFYYSVFNFSKINSIQTDPKQYVVMDAFVLVFYSDDDSSFKEGKVPN